MVTRVAVRTDASFGNLLRRRRIGAGLTLEAMSARAALAVDLVVALERDERRPAAADVAALCGALELAGERRAAFERAGAAVVTPAPLSPAKTGAATTNLPGKLPAFIGREHELAQIRTALARSRLVTLFGPGGVGKTRTAIQAALDALLAFPDGVWVVELSSIADPALVPAAIGAVFGIADADPARPVLDAVAAALRGKRVLLVLDNCEHVVGAAAAAVAALLENCPGLHVVATSREALGLDDEVLYALPPLEPSQALALFSDRARAAAPGFALTETVEPEVTAICGALDGIPFAIELAAARLATLSVRELAERLDDRIQALGEGNAPVSRQKTLRALIDWSFDLLDARERVVFTRLAVFRGGWTADAARAVCAPDGEVDVDLVLGSLVAKSLAVADPQRGRFRFAVTTAQYAAERLLRSGEADSVTLSFVRWVRGFAREADAAWETTGELDWRERVERELDNVRAALEWALVRGRAPLLGAEIAASLGHYWRFAKREGRRLFEAALAALDTDAPPALSARIALGLAWTLPVGRAALDAAERAVRAYRELDDRRHLAMALFTLNGSLRDEEGWLERGEAVAQEALALARAEGCRRILPSVLGAVADRRRQRGALDDARALLEEALEIAREEGNLLGLSTALSRLAEVEFTAHDFAAARRYGAEATLVDEMREAANAVSADRCDLAAYALADGDLAAAVQEARAVFVMAERVGQPVHVAIAIEHLAVAAALRGDVARASPLLAFTDCAFRRHGYARQYVEHRGLMSAQTVLDDALTLEAAADALRRGEALSESEAIRLALEVEA